MTEPSFLTDAQLVQLSQLLPTSAQFDPLEPLYSTAKHGYSLKSLYRIMLAHAEEIRGVMMIIMDADHQVFGAIVNCPILPSPDFYGNGESLLFTFCPDFRVFSWTGKNNFIIKADIDSLSIGASHGHNGLWIDSELLHGVTQFCSTFDNDQLTLNEDFVIFELEIWAALA